MKISILRTVRSAIAASALSMIIPLLAGADYYVTPAGNGAQDGSDWANATSQSQLQSTVNSLLPGETVYLGSGSYTFGDLVITGSGLSGSPKQIVGINTGGGLPILQGVFDITSKTASGRGLDFSTGPVHHWNFKDFTIRNQGTAIYMKLIGTTDTLRTNINFEGIQIDSVLNGINLYNASEITVTDCHAVRYKKKAFRVGSYTSFATFLGCTADCTGGDPNFPAISIPAGFSGDDTDDLPIIHDIQFIDCVARNNGFATAAGAYWNGDGFSFERGTYNVDFIRCEAYDNDDGGFDNKCDTAYYEDCIAAGNSRGFRQWTPGAVMVNCLSAPNSLIGGGADSYGIWVGFEGGIQMENVTTYGDSYGLVVDAGGVVTATDSIFTTTHPTDDIVKGSPTLVGSVTYRPGQGVDPDFVAPSFAWRGDPLDAFDSQHYGSSKGFYSSASNFTPNAAPTFSNVASSVTSGTAPLFVAFSAFGTDSDGRVVRYDWDFGNGATRRDRNGSTTYTEPGTYDATVTITDNRSRQTSATIQIVVSAAGPVPLLSGPYSANGYLNESFSQTVETDLVGVTFSAAGLPDGLAIDPATGTISGTPTASGQFMVEVTAQNQFGSSHRSLQLDIAQLEAAFYVSPDGSGDQDGSDWTNAAPQSQLQSLVTNLQPGETVYIGSGLYTFGDLKITGSGLPGSPKQVIGVDTGGGLPILQGVFDVNNSASGRGLDFSTGPVHHWNFKNLAIRNQGVGVYMRQTGTTDTLRTNLTFEGMQFDSVEDGLRLYNASHVTVTDCHAIRYTKRAFRVGDYTSFATFTGCTADCTGGDPDFPARSIPAGFSGDQTNDLPIIHDIQFIDCIARNNGFVTDPDVYWNGDGFSFEPGSYNISFLRCEAYDNDDGGFDNKCDAYYKDCIAAGNSRGFRQWTPGAVMINCLSAPNSLVGGRGGSYGIWIGPNGGMEMENVTTYGDSYGLIVDEGGEVTARDSIFTTTHPSADIVRGTPTLVDSVAYRPGEGVDPDFVDPSFAWRGDPSNAFDSQTYGASKGYNSGNSTILPNAAPSVTASASTLSGEAPLTVDFSALGADSDGRIVRYHWDFGNGETARDANASTTFDTPGAYTATVTVTDNRSAQASITLEIAVGQQPVITSPTNAAATYGQPFSYTISATANASTFGADGLPPGLDLDAANGEISGIPTAAGNYTVTLSASNGGLTGTATLLLDVARAAQSIAFPAPESPTLGDPAIALAATASSDLPVTYTVASGPASLNGNLLTAEGAGSIVVAAQQAGDANFLPAPAVSIEIQVAPASATISLEGLWQLYDGQPRTPSVVTDPEGLSVTLTYDGNPTPPVYPGDYEIQASVSDPNYAGTADRTLVVRAPVTVRHAPTLNGLVDGSLHVLTAESIVLNSGAAISGDLLVPGTATVQINGQPIYGGTLAAAGDPEPTGHQLTLNGGAVLRHLVNQVDPVALPAVAPPSEPSGTRHVVVNAAPAELGDLATLRDITLNGGAGIVAVPPGAYGAFRANGSSGFALGIQGSTTPATYELQSLTLNGNSQLEIVGPVVLTVAGTLHLNGDAGDPESPEKLLLRLASGGLTLNGNATLNAYLEAPEGTVILNGNTELRGGVSSDRLIINSNATLTTEAP